MGVSISFKGVSRVFEGNLQGVSGKLHWCFKKVLKKFKESFKSVSRKFQGYFVSRKIEGCFNGDLSGFQGYLK